MNATHSATHDSQTWPTPRAFRDALGCFGTGITVVTLNSQSGRATGFTANSFTSVSLDPPLVLFCINKKASVVGDLLTSDIFVVNVLHAAQQAVSAQFARSGIDRFQAIELETAANGSPIIADATAAFECTRHALVDAGDHYIVIGRVTNLRFDANREPLIYFRGQYRSVATGRAGVD